MSIATKCTCGKSISGLCGNTPCENTIVDRRSITQFFSLYQNMRDDSGDGSSSGVYPDFEVSLVSLEPDEAEYYKEKHDKEFTPWIEISFANDDYDDDGTLVAE